MISFYRGKTKVRIITEEQLTMPHNTTPLYAEGVHMLNGLADKKVDNFLEDHPTIIPLFEIDVISTVDTPLAEEVTDDSLPQDEPDSTTIVELRHARDALERELFISHRVKASALESLNLGSNENPHTLQIANNLPVDERSTLIHLLMDYQDVFAWSYTGMKGLDPQYYQHQIHLHDARPVQQR